jgi:hypothetical protein
MTDREQPLVATNPGGDYFGHMFAARLVRILALLALVLAPLGMIGARPAMAAPTPGVAAHHGQASDHCAGMDQPAEPEPVSCIDCIMVCSGLPAAGSEVAAHPVSTATLPRLPLEQRVHGVNPESEPPPPRFA